MDFIRHMDSIFGAFSVLLVRLLVVGCVKGCDKSDAGLGLGDCYRYLMKIE